MMFVPGVSASGAERFNISGQMRCAPKFENSHQRSAGLAFTGPRMQGQPTPTTASRRSATTRTLSAGTQGFGRGALSRMRTAGLTRRTHRALTSGTGQGNARAPSSAQGPARYFGQGLNQARVRTDGRNARELDAEL